MADTDLDRNHSATPYKLHKARERGQVAKSTDVVSFTVFSAAIVYLTWQGWPACRDQFRLDQALLNLAGRIDASPSALWSLIELVVRSTLLMAAPFLGILVIAAILGNVLQTGPVLSLHPIKPDWERLNPATGCKRLFSMRTLFLAARALLKLLVLAVVAYFALKSLLPQFYYLAGLTPLGRTRTLLDDFASLGLKFVGVLGPIALLDFFYTRRQFAKKMRMSQREVKDEIKHREGDPRVRSRMRDLRRDLLKKSLSLRKTRDADVLITNPTHVAVALRYVHGEMTSPQLLAKGKGFMAAAMRQIAARHQIPVVQNPSLARRLYKELAVNHLVPPNLYAPVARIIVWVFARREARRSGRSVLGRTQGPSASATAVPLSRNARWTS